MARALQPNTPICALWTGQTQPKATTRSTHKFHSTRIIRSTPMGSRHTTHRGTAGTLTQRAMVGSLKPVTGMQPATRNLGTHKGMGFMHQHTGGSRHTLR
mmetsp:Transcript_140843/g.245388  ORF Transcript_140843/g.245388 Transcript_140843/m.245388 type:complete len:100 (+) Transcript_140843:2547-2846(+)